MASARRGATERGDARPFRKRIIGAAQRRRSGVELPEDEPDFTQPGVYETWCIRKVAAWKGCLPVELDNLPMDEIVAKAEELDVQEEIAGLLTEVAQR